jgi:hypothetical protein
MPEWRVNPPEIDIANRWHPFQVVEPSSLSRFTDVGAWEFIADCIKDGCPIKYKPPSELYPDHAYELIVVPPDGGRGVYMKIAIKPEIRRIIGLSFHYERNS